MRYRLTSTALMMALLAFPGTCKKKKPEVPPPQAQAPTATQEPQPQTPPAATEQAPPQTEEKKTEENPAQTAPAKKPKPKPRSTTKKTQPEMKKTTPPASATTTTKPPAQQQPSAPESGQLTASLSGTEAARRRQETAQLLAGTDGELKGITRTLTSDEQNIVLQIRGYMQQAQAADKDGDLDRARNLAMKAKLLADDLAKK
jgi:outer membrane biosynthesis protein TonB